MGCGLGKEKTKYLVEKGGFELDFSEFVTPGDCRKWWLVVDAQHRLSQGVGGELIRDCDWPKFLEKHRPQFSYGGLRYHVFAADFVGDCKYVLYYISQQLVEFVKTFCELVEGLTADQVTAIVFADFPPDTDSSIVKLVPAGTVVPKPAPGLSESCVNRGLMVDLHPTENNMLLVPSPEQPEGEKVTNSFELFREELMKYACAHTQSFDEEVFPKVLEKHFPESEYPEFSLQKVRCLDSDTYVLPVLPGPIGAIQQARRECIEKIARANFMAKHKARRDLRAPRAIEPDGFKG